MNLIRLSTVFQEHFTPTRNFYLGWTEIFGQKARNETAEQQWTKLCKLKTESIFEDITLAELRVSKLFFQKLTGNSGTKSMLKKELP